MQKGRSVAARSCGGRAEALSGLRAYTLGEKDAMEPDVLITSDTVSVPNATELRTFKCKCT